MKKYKICFVAQDIYPLLRPQRQIQFIGGAELQQLLLASVLSDRGYEVSFITKDHAQPKIENINSFMVYASFREDDGIPGLRFFYPRLLKIWKALNKTNADIYYVRSAGFLLAVVALYSKIIKSKTVYCGANDPDFDLQILKHRLNIRDRLLYLWGLKQSDVIVTQNEKQQQLVSQNFKRKSVKIYNGFRNNRISRIIKEEILWIGSFAKQKNPHLFLELAKRFPNEKFVMIGGNSNNVNSEEETLKLVIAEGEIIKNFTYRGFLPFDEVEISFNRCKLFINTSAYEGFPNTFLQAWSRGIPIVSFFDPDGLIKENNLGIIVENFEEMVDAVSQLLNNSISFDAQEIIKYYSHHLTIENAVDKYEKIFAELLL